MKIYQIKEKNTDRYYSVRINGFQEGQENGSLFTSTGKVKRAVGYQKRILTRYMQYCRVNQSGALSQYQRRLNELLNAEVIEYEMVQEQKLAIDGGIICDPIPPEKEEEPIQELEKIDFSSI